MTEPVPIFAQETYAILYNRFKDESFTPDYLTWFISKSMVKKTLHTLEKAGWIKRVGRGSYVCIKPEDIFRSMVKFRVPGLLKMAGMEYAYAEASAVEIWTDHSYIQRSWEHSPYYVSVLRSDLEKWISYLRKHRISVFVDAAEPALGEFVILKPKKRLAYVEHNSMPVETLDAAVRYCEKHIETFEYPLAYLTAKYKVSTKASIDRGVLEEAAKAI